MIILTQEQAKAIATNSLRPILIKSGEYILPERVLDDPLHAEARSVLENLPIRDVDPDEFYSADELEVA